MTTRKMNMKDPAIEMSSGKLFHFNNPEFDLHDIVYALSGIPRFGARASWDYSVADHVVLVARICLRLGGDPREGLVHDFPEAFLLDMPTPIKKLMPDYEKLEKRLAKQLHAWAGLPSKLSDITKKADCLALFLEADSMMKSRGRLFSGYEDYADEVRALKQRGVYPKRNTRGESFQELMRWCKKYNIPSASNSAQPLASVT